MDLDERRTLGHVQLRREIDDIASAKPCSDVTFWNAFGFDTKVPLPCSEQQSFLLEIAERLAHRDAADVEHRAEFVLGRHPAVR